MVSEKSQLPQPIPNDHNGGCIGGSGSGSGRGGGAVEVGVVLVILMV